MNNRELLKMAAKAAGIEVNWCDQLDVGVMDALIIPHPMPHFKMQNSPHKKWNPLEDDGDASRLAIKLCAEGKMKIQIVEDYITCFYNHDGAFVPYTWGYETCSPDEAFRECITGAAAAIGELMP